VVTVEGKHLFSTSNKAGRGSTMGKRRGEDAGLDMHARREDYDATEAAAAAGDSFREDMTSGVVSGARERTIRSEKVSKHRSNPFGSVNLLGTDSDEGKTPKTAATTSSNLFGATSSGAVASSGNGVLFGSGVLGIGKNKSTDSPNPLKSALTGLGSSDDGSKSSLFGGSSSAVNSRKLDFGTSTSSGDSKMNGGSSSSGSGLFKQKSSEASASASNSMLFGSKPLSTSGPPSSSSSSNGFTSSKTYLRNVAALNKSFTLWVDGQLKADPASIMIDGVLMYVKYATKELKAEMKRNKSGDAKTFEEKSTSSPQQQEKKPLFGSSGSSLFGNGPSSANSGFSSLFGGGMKTSATSGSGLFGASASSHAEETDEDEKKDEKSIVEDSVRDDETQLAKERAKIFFLNPETKEWGSKGVGDLALLQEKESKRTYVVLRNDSGRIMSNIPLYKGLSISVEEKSKSVGFAAVSYKEDDDGSAVAEFDGKPIPFKVKFKNVAIAESLKSTIERALSKL